MGAGDRMGKRMKEISIRQIKDYFKGISEDYEIYGNLDDRITGFSPFGTYKPGTVTWIKNMEKYREFSSTGKMADPMFIIIDKEVEKASNYANRLVCSNPKYAFALLLKEFFECKNDFGIGKESIVSKDACLEDGISIGCNCLIEEGVTIGRGTKIYHNVVIREGTVIGSFVYIYAADFTDRLSVRKYVQHRYTQSFLYPPLIQKNYIIIFLR